MLKGSCVFLCVVGLVLGCLFFLSKERCMLPCFHRYIYIVSYVLPIRCALSRRLVHTMMMSMVELCSGISLLNVVVIPSILSSHKN